MKFKELKLATLLSTSSFFAISAMMSAQAQEVAQAQMAQAGTMGAPEQVLVTGSLIRGTVAVGVPVTDLSQQDFTTSGSTTTAELFRTVPAFNVGPGAVVTTGGGQPERPQRVNLRGLDRAAVHSLLMVDGVRFPPQGNGLCIIDPSIIPQLALDRVDILVDGASATYGSDAITGVINLILKRGYDGAQTMLRYGTSTAANNRYFASQLWGRTWEGGDVTVSYEWSDDGPISGKQASKFTTDYTPWGLDNRLPVGGSFPATISTGSPTNNLAALCTNCFAVPANVGQNFNSSLNGGLGPTTPGSASTFAYGSLTSGTNVTDTYKLGQVGSAQRKNSATITFDQRLTNNVSFYAEGFYTNRRNVLLNPAFGATGGDDVLTGVAVPTSNPYYPRGVVPANIRVSYDLATEIPPFTESHEISDRYLAGLNIDLPSDWKSKIYYSQTGEANENHAHSVNLTAASAALGFTVGPFAGSGTTPGIASYTKPSTIPYLNLFCDPRSFQCNSQATLDYISGTRKYQEFFNITEAGTTFDGPVFDIPGGTIKAAIGGLYTSQHYNFTSLNTIPTKSTQPNTTEDPRARQFWATFAQLDVPLVGEMNAFTFVRSLTVEGSWRHDQYSDVGGTSNPKLAVNWGISDDLGLVVRGSWGTSFRAPNYGETAGNSTAQINGWNLSAGQGGQAAPIAVSCAAPAGSASAKLYSAGVACGSTLGGFSISGGSQAAAFLRGNGGIKPETATNYAIGFDTAPVVFLKGLDFGLTWYSIKLDGVIASPGNPTATTFSNAAYGRFFIMPSDVGCTVAQNATPTTCAAFEALVQQVIANPQNATTAAASQVYFLNDASSGNLGTRKLDGIDLRAGYNWEGWSTGIVGTYYLHDISNTLPSDPKSIPIDVYHQNLSGLIAPAGSAGANSGVEILPRTHFRANLGWNDGEWNVTGFVNYDSHYFHTNGTPPNVNNQCTVAGGTVGGGTFPCFISNYTNILPSYYTFDVAFGYSTGDRPANNYLRDVGVEVVINDVLDKHPPFTYRISSQAGFAGAFDGVRGNIQGRQISVTLTKSW